MLKETGYLMEILIWGAGARGRAVKKVCDKLGWTVMAFIDNDKSKLGDLEGTSVVSPQTITIQTGKDVQIWVATDAGEVYAQAKRISDNVLAWQCVEMILQSQTERPSYPEVPLNNYNIQNCRLLKDRLCMLDELAPESSKWKIAEIGVAFGDFSEQILKRCLPEKLYLIDCWDDERFGAGAALVREKFKQGIEAGCVKIMQGYSIEKLKELVDGELDLADIDTVHDYETTRQELELCGRKVKSDGYICGHDYTKFNVYSRCDYGVYDAVNEFVAQRGYEFIYLTMEKHGLQSFCIRKLKERA